MKLIFFLSSAKTPSVNALKPRTTTPEESWTTRRLRLKTIGSTRRIRLWQVDFTFYVCKYTWVKDARWTILHSSIFNWSSKQPRMFDFVNFKVGIHTKKGLFSVRFLFISYHFLFWNSIFLLLFYFIQIKFAAARTSASRWSKLNKRPGSRPRRRERRMSSWSSHDQSR